MLGPYSRFGFHHPGPAYFYASVPLYVLSGERFTGILLTAALLGVLSIALLLRRVGRSGGVGALLAAALVLALFLSFRGPGWLFSAWNPNVAVLPFGLALVSFASLAAGELRALPAAVVAGSFAAQTHLGCLPATAALAIAAALLFVPRLRALAGLPPAGPWPRRPLLLALLAAAVMWAPPLVEQLRPGGGNLAHIVGFSLYSTDRHAAGEALAATGAAVAGWMFGLHDTAAIAVLLLVVLALAGACAAARRTGQAFAIATSLVTLAGIAAAVLSSARVAGPLLPYLLRWMAMLLLGAAAALASAVAPFVRAPATASRRPRLLMSAGLVALALATGRNLALAQSALRTPPAAGDEAQAPARLAEAIDSGLALAGLRPLVEVGPHADRDLVLGVLLALDKAGTRFAVRPFGPFRLGGRFAPDGTEDSRVVLGDEDPALAATPGVRVLGREGALLAYLVPGPP
jgi:hypothetical protein